MPIYVYFVPVIVVAALAWQFWQKRKGLANTKHATVWALAQRLRMDIVQGDATLNLFYLSKPNYNYTRTIKLEGMPYGRPLQWEFTDGTKTRDYLVLVEITTTWGCYFVGTVGVQFPAFEVVLREPNQYLIPQTMQPGLPEARTGDPQIDAIYRVTIADPRWAPALVPALRALEGQLYVHLVGTGQTIMMPITRMGLSYFVHAAEQYSHALEVLGCSLEGKQPPVVSTAPANPYVR